VAIQITRLTEATPLLFLCALRFARRALERCFTADARIQSVRSTFGICGGTSGTGTGFSGSTSIFSCCIISPILQTHSLAHYRRYIISAIDRVRNKFIIKVCVFERIPYW